jgi:hypothetical protein
MEAVTDWVEIELEDDSGRSRRRTTRWSAPSPEAPDEPRERPPRPPLPSRAALGVVAIAGLLAGSALTWALARPGEDGAAAGKPATTETTTPSVSPTSAPTTTAPGDTLPDVARPRPTTTTTPTRTMWLLDRPVLPQPTGLRLVGLSPDGDLVRVDLDGGLVDETEVPGVRSGGGFLVPGNGRTLIGSWDNTGTYLVTDEGAWARAPAGFSNGAPILPGDRPDTAWVQRYDQRPPYGAALELMSFEGDVVAGPIDIAGGWTNWGDQRGSVLVEAPGGTYAVSAAGALRLTTGRVLAAGMNHLLVKECDESLQCTVALVERDTGARSALPPELSLGDGSFLPGTPSIAPDGNGIVVFGQRGAIFGLEYVDLLTHASVRLGDPGGMAVGWTADGRYLLALSGVRLSAVDRATVTEIELDERFPSLATFTLVPA